MSAPARTNPITGLARPGHTTLFQMPSHCTGSGPPAASAAPTRPPTSACDDDDGRPRYHVKRFHAIAPISAARIRCGVTRPGSVLIRPSPTVFATAVDENAPRKFMMAAISHSDPRRQRAGGDGGGDGIRRVVEAVREVERECDRDDHDQEAVAHRFFR